MLNCSQSYRFLNSNVQIGACHRFYSTPICRDDRACCFGTTCSLTSLNGNTLPKLSSKLSLFDLFADVLHPAIFHRLYNLHGVYLSVWSSVLHRSICAPSSPTARFRRVSLFIVYFTFPSSIKAQQFVLSNSWPLFDSVS